MGRGGNALMRSRPIWLLDDGAHCVADQPIVAFNLGLGGLAPSDYTPFSDERTLQVALAPRVAGRLRIAPSGGGGLQDLWGTYNWADGGERIGELMVAAPVDASARTMRPMFLAGRRTGWAVDCDATLLPGWNARARAWWGDQIRADTMLASLGVCDATAIVRGVGSDFRQFFAAAGDAFHVTHHSEHPLVFCALVLLEQLHRTDSDRAEISRDLLTALAQGNLVPTPEDYFFIGNLLARLNLSPLTERATCINSGGAVRLPPARFALLSVLSETKLLLRHKRLGYHVHVLTHDIRAAGAASRALFKQHFEPVQLTMDEIESYYRQLIKAAKSACGTRFVVLNRIGSDERESLFIYKGLGSDQLRKLPVLMAKELNVMLDGLAAEGLLDILDADARAAELGTRGHVADGAHYSRKLEDVLRLDLMMLLNQRSGSVVATS